MERRKITISKKDDDSYKVISIRIKERTLKAIDDISARSNRSRNEIINILLDGAVENAEIEDS